MILKQIKNYYKKHYFLRINHEDSLEKFLRAIGELIEYDASIKEILGQIAEHYKNSTELELDFEDIVVKIDTEMSVLGYAKKVPFVVALIENSKAFLESQGNISVRMKNEF